MFYGYQDDDEDDSNVARALAGESGALEKNASTTRAAVDSLSPPPESNYSYASKDAQSASDSKPSGDDDSSFTKNLNVWAIAADLLMNNGKGLGQIIGMANEQTARNRHDKKEAARAKLAASEHAEERNYARGRDERNFAFQEKKEAADQERLKTTDIVAARARDMAEWKQGDDSQRAWNDDASAEKKAADVLQLQKDELAERSQHDRATEDDARSTHADAAAYRLQHSEDVLTAKRQHDSDAAAAAGVRRDDKLEQQADKFGTDYEKANKRSLDALSSLSAVESVLNKARYKGKDLPGIGTLDSRKPDWMMALAETMGGDKEYQEDERTVRTALPNLTNAVLREESGAAASDAERYSTAVREGASPGASEAQVRAGLKASRELLESRIRGASVGNPERARAVVGAHKLNPDLIPLPPAGGDAVVQSIRTADPSRSKDTAEGDATAERLGLPALDNTGQRSRDIPKVDAQPGVSGDRRTPRNIVSPSGKKRFEGRMLSDAEMQKLLRKGFKEI